MKSIVAAISILLCACPTATANRPESVVNSFYAAHVRARPSGLPEGAHLDRIKPMLSTRLGQQIADALQYREQWIASHPPDEKPPFVDGDPFTSVFEGPKSFQIVRTDRDATGKWNVRVQFRDTPEITWEDTVVVTQENGRFVIDEIVFSGMGEFNPSGTLSDRLTWREE